MGNKTTVAITKDQFKNIISTIKEGFMHDGKHFFPNIKLATALIIEANLGIRIGDVLNLTLNNFIKDGNRWRLNIIEEKTNKPRKFTVQNEIYNYIKMYVLENNIKYNAKMFQVKERNIQQNLQIVAKYLKMDNIGTHSFRKYFATSLYNNNDHDIILVQQLLQHSSPAISQKYIGISSQLIEEALNNHVCLP